MVLHIFIKISKLFFPKSVIKRHFFWNTCWSKSLFVNFENSHILTSGNHYFWGAFLIFCGKVCNTVSNMMVALKNRFTTKKLDFGGQNLQKSPKSENRTASEARKEKNRTAKNDLNLDTQTHQPGRWKIFFDERCVKLHWIW